MQAAPTLISLHPLMAVYQMPSESQFSSRKMERATQSATSQSESPEKDEHKPRALVVDDAQDVTEMIAMFLRHAGYEPVMAFNAQEALDAARTGQFDVVVSDIGMPGMNGYELAVALRELPSYSTTPMIAVTGFSMYDDRGRALQSGFNAHLTKPINPMALLELIKRLRD
ncbi:MAG TPA: response regulator [Pyrinomonadaceae bacterium]|jgi:two-component system CheB/CheR fusion protein